MNNVSPASRAARILSAAALAASVITPIAAEAAVGVTNVVCTQRYPWNGMVDIDYEVLADDPAADVWVYATGFDKDANVSMGVRAISGDGANASVKPGKRRMTWDVTSDYPGFNSTAFTVKMTAITGGAPSVQSRLLRVFFKVFLHTSHDAPEEVSVSPRRFRNLAVALLGRRW